MVIGGEAVGASALDAWFAEEGRRPRLFNTYGPTETTVSVTVHEVRGRHDDANVIGRPIANTRVYVLDAWLRPAPIGVAGELYIGGVQVAEMPRPAGADAGRFIDDPFVAGGRLYKDEDLARWRTDGSLEYLGRNDFQVKIRGFRIELGRSRRNWRRWRMCARWSCLREIRHRRCTIARWNTQLRMHPRPRLRRRPRNASSRTTRAMPMSRH
ncbi:AMP-binding protein [Burkholderia pseudomallei]